MTDRKSDGPGRAMTGPAHKQLPQLVKMQSAPAPDALEMQSAPAPDALEMQSAPALEMQSTRTSSRKRRTGRTSRWQSSGESLVMDDPDYIAPSVQNLLLTDVTQVILNANCS
jgi:hypothetical protein